LSSSVNPYQKKREEEGTCRRPGGTVRVFYPWDCKREETRGGTANCSFRTALGRREGGKEIFADLAERNSFISLSKNERRRE